ncbi:conserved hypothetical protein [Desulforamulus reducens MI-1]|uniref:N-acetyltransferase domain-containing protein n=1 Tax=Desulforamulus reducens (strain ATCC BAA-1160 / DSM 100696 / MI-1) TaxID=349161 RepID=A4J5M1_DESRM|nr:GNAT family N-acetyltransferase [Desulforamulus reducens]ABO50374.1 conserved hypothetical protein [Desulforamulus reducens MI-1]
MLKIIKVKEPGHWQKFLELPWLIYRKDPLWTPWADHGRMFDPQSNPILRHVRYECFLALDNDKPVGRIAAITDDLLADKRVGLFGCFESIDSSEVAGELIKAASQSLSDRGKNIIQGPATLNTSQQVGFLVEGFEKPPLFMMPYNPPYYIRLMEENGFYSILGLYSYSYSYSTKIDAKLASVAKRAARIPNIRIRPVNLNNPWREGEKLAAIHNETMTNQWGFVPMDQEEAASFIAGLRGNTDPELLIFCEVDNKPVGVCLMMPDAGPRIRAARRSGFNLPFTRSKLLRVGVLGVSPEYRRRGVVALLIDRARRTMLRKGYQQAELSLIMDTNKDMNRIITSAVGGQVSKRYRVYQKDL